MAQSATPFSREFIEKPPTVESETITVRFPSKGTDKDTLKFTVNNPTVDRMTYKISGGTKADCFLEAEVYGFIPPKSSQVAELQPLKMANSDGWNKWDYLELSVAPAPIGELWDAKEVWGKGNAAPKQQKTYKISIKCEEKK